MKEEGIKEELETHNKGKDGSVVSQYEFSKPKDPSKIQSQKYCVLD